MALPPPTVSNVFWIGVDNALIQVPQNYTVPANPPSTPNPPVNTTMETDSTTTGTTATVCHDTGVTWVVNHWVAYYLNYTSGPAAGQTRAILSNTAHTITTNAFSSTPNDSGDVFKILYATPTIGGTTTTKDSVTVYVSAIKGFNNPLTLSFFLQKIDSSVDPNMSSINATTATWVGKIGSAPTAWTTGTFTPLASGESGWKGLLSSTLVPNAGNALNTYTTQNYQTLFVNPENTGNVINPTLPPSYKVNIFAYDSITNTYAVCDFTLVVLPSIATYGLGVLQKIATANTVVNKNSNSGTLILFVKSVTGFVVGQQIVIGANTPRMEPATIGVVNSHPVPFLALDATLTYTHTKAQADPVAGNMAFCNSVDLLRSGFITLFYYFYPLEPKAFVPNPITITVNVISKLIDASNTTLAYSPGFVTPIPLNTYSQQIVIPTIPTITRDSISNPVVVTLYLVSSGTLPYDPTKPTNNHTLFELIGTDTENVSVSSYTVVTAAD